MSPGDASVLRPFLIGVVLWLPPCFAAWYYMAILTSPGLAFIGDWLFPWLWPEAVAGVAAAGINLDVVTRLGIDGVSAVGLSGVGTGELIFELNPLKLGYSVPLYTALVLAVPSDDPGGRKLLAWLFGMTILVLTQVFGIGAEILKILAFDLGDQARPLLGFNSWGYELVVVGYQIGTLILPSVVPIMLWFGQFGTEMVRPAEDRCVGSR